MLEAKDNVMTWASGILFLPFQNHSEIVISSMSSSVTKAVIVIMMLKSNHDNDSKCLNRLMTFLSAPHVLS